MGRAWIFKNNFRFICLFIYLLHGKRRNLTSQCFGLDLCETSLSVNLGLKCFLLFLLVSPVT